MLIIIIIIIFIWIFEYKIHNMHRGTINIYEHQVGTPWSLISCT